MSRAGYTKVPEREKRLLGPPTKEAKLERLEAMKTQERHPLTVRMAAPGELPPARPRPRKKISPAAAARWAKEMARATPSMPGR